MAIRLSGLSSGLDTEALVSALMSSYNLQKDNLVKAQTKLSWKQDAWKTLNTSIYSFYSGSLASAKSSVTYNIKNTTISNSSYAKVSASSSAVNGTQKLIVTKLAATGYLTGGVISGSTSSGGTATLTGTSKLSEITSGTAISGGSISVTVDGKSTDIDITSDMTINGFCSKLKSAGLTASFDATNQRIFVSSPTSGESHDFTLTASDSDGLTALQTLGLYTKNDSDTAEYKKWAEYTDDEIAALKESEYNSSKVSYSTRATSYATRYNAAQKIVSNMDANGQSLSDLNTQLETYYSALDSRFSSYRKTDDEGNYLTDDDGHYVYDTDKIEEDGYTDEYDTIYANVTTTNSAITKYTNAAQEMADTEDYVIVEDDGTAVSAATDTTSDAYANIVSEVDAENATISSNISDEIDQKRTYYTDMYNNIDSVAASEGAVRVVGCDAVISLNGAEFTNNTNNFTINGLTIQATAETGSESVSITTETDVDGIYDSIKSFLSEYNTLITAMDTAYNASSSKGYEPLTSDEKSAMTDDEIEEWEKKIKDSLLRKDSVLGNASSSLKTDMMKTYTINGTSYSLSSFGIATLGYFSSGDNEKGVYHIDGDTDDSNTKGNSDKLRAAIASDPESVVSFFTQLATDMYSDLTKRMGSTSLSSIYYIYNDKQMATEYSEYTTKISDQEDKIATWEDYYYNKFTKMESALATLNSNSSSLSSLLGS